MNFSVALCFWGVIGSAGVPVTLGAGARLKLLHELLDAIELRFFCSS